MIRKYIVKEYISHSMQGELKVGTILDCDGDYLYLKNGKMAMALNSLNGRKVKEYIQEPVGAEDF